ncbi:uncharacterized protein CLUP02_10987 [Colletotrichum lupini]|uniref:Uncharacterized protein n=1 Tax=Colletotrichum lupini TaxID=145971 RepID=A0A9Q8SXS5_9PEZI|nr:uncharacterized protein CLUP02_10987 [Colletotrichum lupini]UQC85489.1 hypothetical protein CLUP02_10987 [Colletotrichum lupini]
MRCFCHGADLNLRHRFKRCRKGYGVQHPSVLFSWYHRFEDFIIVTILSIVPLPNDSWSRERFEIAMEFLTHIQKEFELELKSLSKTEFDCVSFDREFGDCGCDITYAFYVRKMQITIIRSYAAQALIGPLIGRPMGLHTQLIIALPPFSARPQGACSLPLRRSAADKMNDARLWNQTIAHNSTAQDAVFLSERRKKRMTKWPIPTTISMVQTTPADTISPHSRTNEDVSTDSSQDGEKDEGIRSTSQPLQLDGLLPPTAQPTPPTSASVVYNSLFADSNNSKAPRQDASPIEFNNYAVTLPVSSSKLWRFPDTTYRVAREDQIPVPSEVLSLWPETKTGLQNDLRCVVTQMDREQAKERNRVKRTDISRKTIFPQLWMSGKPNKTDLVTISPCIWILCGSNSCCKKVRRRMKDLELPELFTRQPIQIRERAPELFAAKAIVPLPQLRYDVERNAGISHHGGTILYHMEAPTDAHGDQPACGLLCCVTFIKNGKIVDQRISRIGGLLTDGTEHARRPIAITTSHGLLNSLWADNDDNGDSDSQDRTRCLELQGSIEDNELLWAIETDSCSESESESGSELFLNSDADAKNDPTSPSKGKASITQDAEELLGGKNHTTVPKWHCFEEVIGIRLCGELIQAQNDRSSLPLPADYALLRSDVLLTLKNLSSSTSNIEISTLMTNDMLQSGPLSLMLGSGEPINVILLPEITTMPFAEKELVVRKLQLPIPLAPGTSGIWLAKGSSFCGMIVAAFPGQPLALMATAEDIINDIGRSFPLQKNTVESNELGLGSSVTQAVAKEMRGTYSVYSRSGGMSDETSGSRETLPEDGKSLLEDRVHVDGCEVYASFVGRKNTKFSEKADHHHMGLCKSNGLHIKNGAFSVFPPTLQPLPNIERQHPGIILDRAEFHFTGHQCLQASSIEFLASSQTKTISIFILFSQSTLFAPQS